MLLTAALVSSCGNGASAHQGQAGAPPPAVAAASASNGPVEPPVPAVDVRPCLDVQAILSHITVDTAHWSPTHHPFDNAIATRIATESAYMNQQAMTADYTLRKAVSDTARAFGEVSRSIAARSRKQLDRAITRSRVAYAVLKKVCHYSADG